jgi:hypothetical protein
MARPQAGKPVPFRGVAVVRVRRGVVCESSLRERCSHPGILRVLCFYPRRKFRFTFTHPHFDLYPGVCFKMLTREPT